MSELRKDPVIGRWVIIAVERGNRPEAYIESEPFKPNGDCPFCPGHEHMTPPEVMAYRPPETARNDPGWWVRVVSNKYPALASDGPVQRYGDGMFDRMDGIGAHEVVIETPRHDTSISDMTQGEVQEVLWAYRDRVIELGKDPRFRYVKIFKNHGRLAGATLAHPHSQIIALPIVPKRVQEELEGAKKYYDYKERCVYCDMNDQEQKDQSRLVEANERFVAFCPYASRFPFETWIVPRRHDTHFRDIHENDIVPLANLLNRTLYRIKKVLRDPAYNFIIHTTPNEYGQLPYYHWHIEVMPKLTQVAGFEWGTGFYINPTPPEVAAEYLREVEIPVPARPDSAAAEADEKSDTPRPGSLEAEPLR